MDLLIILIVLRRGIMVGALLVENVMALVVTDHITAHRIITIVIAMVIASRKKVIKSSVVSVFGDRMGFQPKSWNRHR